MIAARTPENAFAPENLWPDWRMLCETIGERRAGTAAEHRAAAFIAGQFESAGLDVSIEPFPCAHRRSATTEVHERTANGWHALEATSLVGAPATPGGRAVTGKLVWVELPEAGRRIKPGAWRDCIVAVFGSLPTEVALHRRLVAAQPLAVVHVDERLPFGWTKNDGVYPYWVRRYGMPPTVTVPYTDAWRWRRDGVRELRVRVALDQPAGESRNVIAEWRGRQPAAPAIVLTAHHDTQCGNVGADDNASGVVALLALARALSKRRLERTVRLISFGAEEQLSVGSAAYVRRHRVTPATAGLVINFDSVSSPLGHWMISVAGSPKLQRFTVARLAARGLDAVVQPEITPFSDHFAFNRAGVPSLWFMRTNSSGGRWQHHSVHDNLLHVSAEELRRLLTAVQPLIATLGNSLRWPFPTALPAAQHALARRLGRQLFG
ncbi:MAG: M28 family peptidase [Opitutaceae bacterium]|nr:M28 family peptidase [Opitutaceae bacterium]